MECHNHLDYNPITCDDCTNLVVYIVERNWVSEFNAVPVYIATSFPFLY